MENHIVVSISRRCSILRRKMLQAAEAGRYSFDCQHIPVLQYFRTEVSCNLKRGFVVPAWGISLEMRRSVSKGCGDDGTLGKALRHRHHALRAVCISAIGPYEPEITIYRPAHFRCRPLAWRCGFIFGQGGICIWRSMPQAIDARLTAGLAHAERHEPSVRQCTYPLVAGSLLLAAP